MAIASGLVTWPSGFEDPDAGFEFSLPSGRQCEFRMIVDPVDQDAAISDPSPDRETSAQVQAEVVSWLRDGDLATRLDLESARVSAQSILAEQRESGMTISISPDGWLEDTAVTSDTLDPDIVEAFAVDRAVRAEMQEHLNSAGYPEYMWDFGTEGGVKCEAE